MSSTEPPRTPPPAYTREAQYGNAEGTSATQLSDELDSVARVSPDPSFFKAHLNPCTKATVNTIRKDSRVGKWVTEIMAVTVKEHKLYAPVSDLLTHISSEIYKALKARKDKAHLRLPEREITFLDHHRYALTHFPVGRLDDKPDIIGVVSEPSLYDKQSDGCYKGIPYHHVETVVEAKAIYGEDGQAQATRYAFNVQQARPDRPGFYALSVKPQHFRVVFSSPLGIQASEHTQWTNLELLCAYVYSLYDPPKGHILYDRTVYPSDLKGGELCAPTWTVLAGGERYTDGVIIFLGDPWARRTTVFRVKKPGILRTVIIKESYVDGERRFDEAQLLTHIHEEGFIPGVVRYISAEDVQDGNQEIVLKKIDGSLTRKKRRIVLADVGFDLEYAKTVNDLLMAVYDALEVHRTLAIDRQVLHRDMSIYNVLMYPTLSPCVDGQHPEKFPPLIDDVLGDSSRCISERQARCLIIDFDNSALLLDARADAMTQAELRCRTGTPSYIARSVAGGVFCCSGKALKWQEPMPELEGEAKERYIKAYGEDRYKRFNDDSNTIHGGVPSKARDLELHRRARRLPFYHRWEYDVESVFWTMYAALLRVWPKDFKETDRSHKKLAEFWKVFSEHSIPDELTPADSRNVLFDYDEIHFLGAFPEEMQDVAEMLWTMISHVAPSYALMDVPPPHDDHLHEAMQRLILQYLVKHRDKPIPLTPGLLRPVENGTQAAINRGTYGESVQQTDSKRGKKRSSEPGSRNVKRSKQISQQENLPVLKEDPPVFKEGWRSPFKFVAKEEA